MTSSALLYRVGGEADSAVDVEMAIRFQEFHGTYALNTHNTRHEDHSMLLRWDIEHPGQLLLMPTPVPVWDRVGYADFRAPDFRTGGRGRAGCSTSMMNADNLQGAVKTVPFLRHCRHTKLCILVLAPINRRA